MLNSAAHSVFALPELILLVSDHLDPRDLTQCIRVCRDWLHHLEPILWTNFYLNSRLAESFSDTPAPPLKTALIRNLPHIRTIRTSAASGTLLQILIGGSTTDPSTFCSNLNRLEIENVSCEHDDLASQHLTTLLELNPRLTHLEFPFAFLDVRAVSDSIAKVVSASISKLENLQHLSIHSDGECEDSEAMNLLLQACLPLPNLTELNLDMDLTWCGQEESLALLTIIREVSRARFSQNPSATKIKSLRLPSNRYGYQNPLPPLLFGSNLLDLQSCEIPWFQSTTDPVQLEQMVRRSCSNLKHLCSRGQV